MMLNVNWTARTTWTGIAAIVAAVGGYFTGEMTGPAALYAALGGLAVVFGRAAIKPAAALLMVGFLAGCGTLPGGMMSPGTGGSPATGGNLAQTVGGDQAAVPGTATGGTAAVNYFMASSVPPGSLDKLLALAAEQKWTAAEVTAALRAAAGAPETVTVGDASVNGGDADNAGAGSGGASGLAGTSGTVTR